MTIRVQELELDCQKCSEKKKRAWGCEEETKEPFLTIDKEEIRRCPLKLITVQSMDYIRFYGYYKEGYLPNAGGILEQPAKFLDTVTEIENILAEIRQEKELELKRHSHK